MICSCALLQLTLGSALLTPTWVLSLCFLFSPLLGASIQLMKFARVSSF